MKVDFPDIGSLEIVMVLLSLVFVVPGGAIIGLVNGLFGSYMTMFTNMCRLWNLWKYFLQLICPFLELRFSTGQELSALLPTASLSRGTASRSSARRAILLQLNTLLRLLHPLVTVSSSFSWSWTISTGAPLLQESYSVLCSDSSALSSLLSLSI